ncbi:hypothetical protein HGG64_01440 [Mycoplasma phocoeninasale]|uniref:Uncharacterized protein n=1 Tax=Mycoplasma phocoeninasale TaxID=2726117 RepID=A0A858U324_9MOLU|nr:hypothetical protein [Mycoplasma phocoeninasale]QJG66371.1 hypothetical protein HGG64_01440 [Mycoplasma phocoeninasale]
MIFAYDTHLEQTNNLQKFYISVDEREKIQKFSTISEKELFRYLELEIFKYDNTTNYRLEKVKYFSDVNGNPYLYVEYNPVGSLVLSLINNESLIINVLDNSKKINKLNKNKIYSYDFSKNLFFEISKEPKFNKDNEFAKILTNKKINIEKTLNDKNLIYKKNQLLLKKSTKFAQTMPYVPNSIDPAKKIIKAQKEVPHAWFFKTLTTDFGYADPKDFNYHDPWERGLCHYVAAAILLQYGQLFLSQNTFSKQQLEKYYTKPERSKKLNDLVGYPTVPKVNKQLVYDLWHKHGKEAFFTTSAYLVSTIYSLLNVDLAEKGEYPLYIQRRSAGWIKPWKWINDGKPCVVFGNIPTMDNEKSWHAIIVYGYFDNGNKCLAHFGWENHSQVIMSSSLSGQLWLLGVSAYNGKPTIADSSYFKYKDKNIDLNQRKDLDS